mgnify:FL=1
MEDLLTKKELAKHWKVTERTINRYMEDGIISACKLPILRFSPQHVRELDGVKLDKFSPLERKKMESLIKQLQRENEIYKSALQNILLKTSSTINLLVNEEKLTHE